MFKEGDIVGHIFGKVEVDYEEGDNNFDHTIANNFIETPTNIWQKYLKPVRFNSSSKIKNSTLYVKTHPACPFRFLNSAFEEMDANCELRARNLEKVYDNQPDELSYVAKLHSNLVEVVALCDIKEETELTIYYAFDNPPSSPPTSVSSVATSDEEDFAPPPVQITQQTQEIETSSPPASAASSSPIAPPAPDSRKRARPQSPGNRPPKTRLSITKKVMKSLDPFPKNI